MIKYHLTLSLMFQQFLHGEMNESFSDASKQVCLDFLKLFIVLINTSMLENLRNINILNGCDNMLHAYLPN